MAQRARRLRCSAIPLLDDSNAESDAGPRAQQICHIAHGAQTLCHIDYGDIIPNLELTIWEGYRN